MISFYSCIKLHCMYVLLSFFHSAVDGHLDWFCFLCCEQGSHHHGCTSFSVVCWPRATLGYTRVNIWQLCFRVLRDLHADFYCSFMCLLPTKIKWWLPSPNILTKEWQPFCTSFYLLPWLFLVLWGLCKFFSFSLSLMEFTSTSMHHSVFRHSYSNLVVSEKFHTVE